jgi:hypothetical protein
LDNLPESATWEDLMHRIYVRQAIEAGIKDSDQGRTLDVKEVRNFGDGTEFWGRSQISKFITFYRFPHSVSHNGTHSVDICFSPRLKLSEPEAKSIII